MCAIDLPSQQLRDQLLNGMRDRQVLVLGCGERTIRFRPALNVTEDELQIGVCALDAVLERLAAAARPLDIEVRS